MLPIIRIAASIVGIGRVYIYSIDEDRLIETYRSHGFRSLSDEQERSLHTRLEPRSAQGRGFMYMRAWAQTSSGCRRRLSGDLTESSRLVPEKMTTLFSHS